MYDHKLGRRRDSIPVDMCGCAEDEGTGSEGGRCKEKRWAVRSHAVGGPRIERRIGESQLKTKKIYMNTKSALDR